MIYAISSISNLDSLLLRQLRFLPGPVDYGVPPYFKVMSKEQKAVIPMSPDAGAGSLGYGYVLSSSGAKGIPYVVFSPSSECRLLGQAKYIEHENGSLILWSTCDMMDASITADIYWIADPNAEEPSSEV